MPEEEVAVEGGYKDLDDPFADEIRKMIDESDLAKVLSTLVSFTNIEGKTIINERQAKAFQALFLLDGDYPGLGIKKMSHFLLLCISKGGASRKDIRETLRGRLSLGNDNQLGSITQPSTSGGLK